MESLGRKIRLERKALGFTLKRFADLVGTSSAMLQRIETNKKSPSVALLAEISYVLKKPIESFINSEKKGFVKINKQGREMISTKDYKMLTISPFGLIHKDIVINYFKAKAGTVVKPHRNKGYEWIFVIKGNAILEHKGVPHKVAKGDAIYYDAREVHSVKFLTDHESLDIFIRA